MSQGMGRPLDAKAARERAAQAAALADPLRLRVLSALASRPEGGSVAEVALAVGEEAVSVAESFQALSAAGLLLIDDDRAQLSADAWVRFGRLVASGSPPSGRDAIPLSPTDLPPVVETIASDLAYRFGSTFSPETVSRYVAESYALLQRRARVSQHLPSLTSRYAADRLDALATSQGLVLRGTPEILFVCVQNAGRSQIAAALLRHLAGDRVHVRTAGSAPASFVHPGIVEVLDEVGVPLGADYPKPLTDEVVQAADYVITMGCGDACPIYPGRRYMDWELDDPVSLDQVGMRRVRDEIRAHIEALLEELGLTAHPSDASSS